MGAPIFISYRHEDSGPDAIALRDALCDEFGDDCVFMDTSSVHFGAIWPDEVRESLEAAKVVLALIGPDWLLAGIDKWGQRRIDQEEDWVRRELTIAFAQRKKVIPVLVREAELPPADVLPEALGPLPSRKKIDLRHDYWDHDVKLLLAELESNIELSKSIEETRRLLQRAPDPHGDELFLRKELSKELHGNCVRWAKILLKTFDRAAIRWEANGAESAADEIMALEQDFVRLDYWSLKEDSELLKFIGEDKRFSPFATACADFYSSALQVKRIAYGDIERSPDDYVTRRDVGLAGMVALWKEEVERMLHQATITYHRVKTIVS